MATNVGKYPADEVYIAVGRLRRPHPKAVPQSKADEERRLVSTGLALVMTIVFVVVPPSSGSLVVVVAADDDWMLTDGCD